MILLGRCDAPQQRANAENTIYNINNTADIDELIRISLQNAQIGFTRLAMNEAERNDALAKLRNDADKAIAEQLLNAVEEGGFKSLLVQMFLHDPVGTTRVTTSLIPDVSFGVTGTKKIEINFIFNNNTIYLHHDTIITFYRMYINRSACGIFPWHYSLLHIIHTYSFVSPHVIFT